jgi:IS5 family transposase
MDPILAKIDQVLEDEKLYQMIRRDFAKRFTHTEETGRNSTPVEVVERMLAVKHLYGLSYEQTEYQVRDSLVLRQFCRVYLEDVPDDTTLIRWAGVIQPDTLKRFNERLTRLATQWKVTKGRKLRTDGTVVETNIHPPSDSSLLADSVRVLGRTLQRAKQVVGETTQLGKAVFRNRVRRVRQLARQVGEAMRKGGETAQTEGKAAYEKLVQATQATVQQAKQVLPVLRETSNQQAERLAKTLETFLPRAEQVIQQTVRRVFHDEQVPVQEKILSLFEPHTTIIRRDKARTPLEFGRKVWLSEVDGGIVSRWEVLKGNPNDKKQWLPNLDDHIEQFGKPPEQASADRGVYSIRNESRAKKRGVKHVILPKPGHKSEERKRYEKQAWFVRGRHWHNGIEGRISVLKRRFGLDRCLDHGETGFEKWVGWGVIANNLLAVGRKLAA